jgi:hypothetical protein
MFGVEPQEPSLRQGVLFEIELIFVAAALRILPDFSVFCRSNPLIPLSCLAVQRTLDLRIHVRIPSEPIAAGAEHQ